MDDTPVRALLDHAVSAEPPARQPLGWIVADSRRLGGRMRRRRRTEGAVASVASVAAVAVAVSFASGAFGHTHNRSAAADHSGRSRQMAYVLTTGSRNHGYGAVVPVNLASMKAGKPLQSTLKGVLTFSNDIVAARGGRTIYVSTDRGIILAISTKTGKIDRTIRVAGVCCEADQLVGAPNGKIAYATNFTRKITPIDLVTGRALRPISVPWAPPEPAYVAISHNGGTLLVAGRYNSQSTVVTVVTNHRAHRPIMLDGQFGTVCVAVNADGTMGYLLRSINGHFVLVPIDIATNSPRRAIKVLSSPYGTSTDQCLVVAPNGRTAYAQIGRYIAPIDLVTGRALRPIRIPETFGISQIGIDPEGTMAYVRGDGGVTPIDLAARKALPTIFFSGNLGGFSLSFSPNGKTALVGIGQLRTGKLLLIHAGTGKVYKSIHVTDGVPASIAVTP
jgi:hypothetical protein